MITFYNWQRNTITVRIKFFSIWKQSNSKFIGKYPPIILFFDKLVFLDKLSIKLLPIFIPKYFFF